MFNSISTPVPIQESVGYQSITGEALKAALQQYGPTVRLDGLLEITRVKRSKAFQLMKEDPTFPKGVPLYDSNFSPKFYWTHEAVAWLEERSNKFRTEKKEI